MADYAISNVPRRVVYAPSGVGPYAFTFEILAQTDIAVYRGSTLLTLTTDYTVTINANGTGSVTLVATAGTSNITIIGARAIQRSSDYTTGGDLFASTLNVDLDSQTIFSQQIAETAQRSIKSAVIDSTALNMDLPASQTRANKLLGFTNSGEPTASSTTVAQLDAAVQSFVNNTANNANSIIYNPAGVGAVSTTAQSKMRETVSVKDFGAVGNGIANDSTAIQAALDSLPLTGGTIYFPSNFYCGIGSTINITKNNVTLLFADWSAGITPLASMTNLLNITSDGVKIVNGVLANQSSYATNGISKSGAVAFGFAVSGCYIASFVNGIVWSSTGNVGLIATNNYFNAQTGSAIRFNEDGRNSLIIENNILGGTYGIYATYTTQQIEGLIIESNLIQTTETSNACIYLNGALYTNITDNNLSGDACIILDAGTVTKQITYTVISGNYVGAKASGTGLVSTGNNTYMTVSNNFFDGGLLTTGVNITDVQFARFTDNTFVNMTGTQLSTTTCLYNNFIGNQFRGAGLPTLEDAASQGIWIGNFDLGTKSPKSYYLYNWQNDVLLAESDWTAYTPTIAPSGGAITAYTATGYFKRMGDTVEVVINISVSNNGTGSGQLVVQLPLDAEVSLDQVLTGQSSAPTLFSLQGGVNNNKNLVVAKYDGTYPVSTGSVIAISGTYKVQ